MKLSTCCAALLLALSSPAVSGLGCLFRQLW